MANIASETRKAERFAECLSETTRRSPQLSSLGPQIGLMTAPRSEEHTSELQSRFDLVCRLLLEKKKARFNTTIVVIKLSVVLFVIALGFRYVNPSNWCSDCHSFAPFGFSGIGSGAAYIFFAYIC